MDSKELLLYLEREKLKKEAIENSEKPIKSGSSSSKQSNQSGGVSFDGDDINVGSDDGKSSSSSTQISNITLPIKSDSSNVKSEAASFKNVPELKASDSSASVVPIKIVDDGVVKTSASTSKISSGGSAVTVIRNFAIVKFTGADNFGKSAYTVGKKAGERATKAIDYFAREDAQTDAVLFGLISCRAEEKLLAEKKKAGNCHYVGEFCSRRIPLIGCVQKKKSSCCFNSKLARIINEQGREQLTRSWGSARNPECKGFTPEEFQRLDMSRINFAEFIESFQLPDMQNIGDSIRNRVTSNLSVSFPQQ